MALPGPALTSDPNSFGYATVKERWPKIISGCIDDSKQYPQVLPDFEKLLASINNDDKIVKFTDEEIKLNSDLKYYNDNFKEVTWQHGPWLFLECYLYQVINNIFLKFDIQDFDVFNSLKQSTLVSSEFGIVELCKKLESFDFNIADNDKLIYFKEFIDISLWGNSTDLSLLAGGVTLDDIKSLQGEEIRKKNEKNILVNDTEKAFEHIQKANGYVDIILDNSGFELFSDLVLAVFLIGAKLTPKVFFHCKKIPWFVSDTLIKDFDELFKELAKFKNSSVDHFIKTIKDYITDEKLVPITHEFWTLGEPFWGLADSSVYDHFKGTKLLIFKGDLNYRKLTGDLNWDKTTPFEEAIQGLAKAKLPILSLRTCKADVVVGLEPGIEEKLLESDGKFWAASGKYAVINFFNSK